VKINAGWVTTFNEYAVVSENRITKIPNDSNMLVAALMGCVVTTGAGVVFNDADVQSYDSVAIFGCGGVGLCAVQAAKLRCPVKLIAVDINPNSLEMAKTFGADVLLNPKKEDVIKNIRELTGGKGVSKTLVCTGSIAAIESAVESTSIPGKCFLVGVPQKGAKISVEAHAVMHERNIMGTLGGGSIPDRDIPAYMELHRRGLLKLEELVSVVRPFSEINEVIKMMRGDTPGRVAVKF
jgi:S-(hydroxymethyl)glutathione dehydrogenase/alcohol dehydrogenase